MLVDNDEFVLEGDATGAPVKQVLRVTELYADARGELRMGVLWYYRAHDTAMAGRRAVRGGGRVELSMPLASGTGDARRVWLATVEDNEQYATTYPVASIDRFFCFVCCFLLYAVLCAVAVVVVSI